MTFWDHAIGMLTEFELLALCQMDRWCGCSLVLETASLIFTKMSNVVDIDLVTRLGVENPSLASVPKAGN
jgi:hypothetical protein